MPVGRECGCAGAHLGDDLLCRIGPQAGHLRQPLHLLLVWAEQSRHLLLELAHLLFEEFQFLEHRLQQPTVDRMELLAGTECIAQLFRQGAQAGIGQRRQSCRVGLPAGERLEHPPDADAKQIRDQAG